MKALITAALASTLSMSAIAQMPVCVAAPPASETDPCAITESYDECSARLVGPGSEDQGTIDAKKTELGDVKANLAQLVALVNTGAAGNSSFEDFLPLLRLFLDGGGASGDDNKLGIEWANPLPFGSMNFQHKLFAALEQSELYAPLEDALRAASLDSEIDPLEDGISEADDVTVGLSFGPTSENLGRNVDSHGILLSKILASVDIPDAERDAADDKLIQFETDNRIRANPKKLFCSFGAVATDYANAATAQLLARKEYLKNFAARLRQAGFYSVLDLVSNQKQLTGSLTFKSRDVTVGPDEFKFAVSYELGGTNMSDFTKYAAAHCPKTETSACLADFLASEEQSIKSSQRLRFIADYTRMSRVAFAMPAPGFSFIEQPSERLSVSATYGQYIGRPMAGLKRARLDASLSYEDFSDDPLRQDRGLATVTVSYPLVEGFYLSLGAVYATKPEFRGDVDEEISARAGFTYKILEDK